MTAKVTYVAQRLDVELDRLLRTLPPPPDPQPSEADLQAALERHRGQPMKRQTLRHMLRDLPKAERDLRLRALHAEMRAQWALLPEDGQAEGKSR